MVVANQVRFDVRSQTFFDVGLDLKRDRTRKNGVFNGTRVAPAIAKRDRQTDGRTRAGGRSGGRTDGRRTAGGRTDGRTDKQTK